MLAEIEVVRGPGMNYLLNKATRIRSRVFCTSGMDPELRVNLLDYCDNLEQEARS